MANLTWGLRSTPGDVDKDGPTISDANMVRFIDWMWYAYPQIDNTDPENPVPKPRTPANEADAFRDWATAQWQGTKANVLRWERLEAAQEAAGDVPPIDPE
jgi:hypothetical protein